MEKDKRLGFFGYYLLAFKKYAQFSGRSTRSEFWYFYLANFLISTFANMLLVIAVPLDSKFSPEVPVFHSSVSFLYLGYCVTVFIPALALSWRRLHDTNRSGAWYFLALTVIGLIPLIIFYCQKSDPAPNRFDEDGENVSFNANRPSTGIKAENLQQIEKLAALRDRGVLTEEEFQKKKSEWF